MARSRNDTRQKKKSRSSASGTEKLSPQDAPQYLAQATALLQTGESESALPVAEKALKCLSSPPLAASVKLPALELLGEIHVELGDPDAARAIFKQAAALDPNASLTEESGGGADKFLWLAQLCEEGGAESVGWFEKGCTVLRREIGEAEAKTLSEEKEMAVEMKKSKLANALCGAAEVYMTDLSWEKDAEERCEALVTEACLAAPESPEPLQTLASVRISQTKLDEARSALERSLEMWSDLPPEDPDIPDYPTRISLARLLMEAELEEKAIDVLDRLVVEDDSSVEAWYLGGWCLRLIANKLQMAAEEQGQTLPKDLESEFMKMLKASRRWLRHSLKLFVSLEYEDDRLESHAEELVVALNNELGNEDEDEGEEEEVWVDEDGEEDDGDEAMEGT